MLELQFTTTLKASKSEFPVDWMVPDQRIQLNEPLSHSVTSGVGTTTPPLTTSVANPFLDPHPIGIHHTNPFLDHGQIMRSHTPTPSGYSPRTSNNLASLGTSTTMPFHTGQICKLRALVVL